MVAPFTQPCREKPRASTKSRRVGPLERVSAILDGECFSQLDCAIRAATCDYERTLLHAERGACGIPLTSIPSHIGYISIGSSGSHLFHQTKLEVFPTFLPMRSHRYIQEPGTWIRSNLTGSRARERETFEQACRNATGRDNSRTAS